jgi:predicted cupin superfamily sugar epimerase
MQPHREGGYYAEIFRSDNKVLVSKEYVSNERSALTSIYFLLPSSSFSAWHKVKSDEIWVYNYGCPVHILILGDNGQLASQILGNPVLHKDAELQVVVPRNHWFCAYLNDSEQFSLISCIVGPGFDFADFELADRNQLIQAFPDHQDFIEKYSNSRSA